jgi:prephenate dehydrogenase
MLVEAAAGKSPADLRRMVGPGFRDTTRVASGAEDVWSDIVATNRVALRKELAGFSRVVGQVCRMLDQGDIPAVRRFLAKSRRRRACILGTREGRA